MSAPYDSEAEKAPLTGGASRAPLQGGAASGIDEAFKEAKREFDALGSLPETAVGAFTDMDDSDRANMVTLSEFIFSRHLAFAPLTLPLCSTTTQLLSELLL